MYSSKRSVIPIARSSPVVLVEDDLPGRRSQLARVGESRRGRPLGCWAHLVASPRTSHSRLYALAQTAGTRQRRRNCQPSRRHRPVARDRMTTPTTDACWPRHPSTAYELLDERIPAAYCDRLLLSSANCRRGVMGMRHRLALGRGDVTTSSVLTAQTERSLPVWSSRG